MTLRLIVMGVSGCGKSTLSAALAGRLGQRQFVPLVAPKQAEILGQYGQLRAGVGRCGQAMGGGA